MEIFIGELLGTMILILFGGGVVANCVLTKSKGENSGWLSITAGWGIAVIIAVFVAQSAGSPYADINPAVSFAKYILGYLTLTQALCNTAAQMIGAFLGAALVWLCYFPHWQATECTEKKRAVFSTSPAIRHIPSNIVTEAIGTAVLVIGVGAIFGKATLGEPALGFGPYLVGMLVWGIGLSLGGSTGYAINPARDLGPRIAHAVLPIKGKGSSDWGYALVPVVGPLLGALLGAVLWQLVF